MPITARENEMYGDIKLSERQEAYARAICKNKPYIVAGDLRGALLWKFEECILSDEFLIELIQEYRLKAK